ncbi:MAG: hypothetical protein HXY25_12515 [Alphaproteobacteria bacterium]|nr:hypothetical protein [Alphaproteobacteria bacterium]
MSGVARLVIVVAIIWMGIYAFLNWDQLRYLTYPEGEPGWFCEASTTDPRPSLSASQLGSSELILSAADVEACLQLDPAGFLHDNYYFFVRQERRAAIELSAKGIAPPLAVIVVVLVLAWIRAGFRRA